MKADFIFCFSVDLAYWSVLVCFMSYCVLWSWDITAVSLGTLESLGRIKKLLIMELRNRRIKQVLNSGIKEQVDRGAAW